MLELVLAILGTVLLMLLPLRMVNIRRMRAWAARDIEVITAADRQNEMRKAGHALQREHAEELAEQARGQEETQEWANRILLNHDWHIGGKADPHDMGVEVQWECAHCPSVVFAPEGSL